MPAADTYANFVTAPGNPYTHALAVVPDDNNDLVSASRALYVGVTGDVTVNTLGGEAAILFKAVPAGTVLAIRAARVKATGTTATNILTLY